MELTTALANHRTWARLFMMSKIQNLNGTHNGYFGQARHRWVVYDVKDTKFEWNSQHRLKRVVSPICCLWCQRYKIWMELTTDRLVYIDSGRLFMMSKIQNLNGTHNYVRWAYLYRFVVYDVKDTKFEWNSQRNTNLLMLLPVVYDVKDTKFEWNSQRISVTLQLT